MQIIPVLDIKGGVVVRGVRGERALYRPIETPLAEGSEPLAVARGFFALAAFPAVYVADLDAIEGREANTPALEVLTEAFENVEFWVDAGLRGGSDVAALAARAGCVAVVGSESLRSACALDGADRRKVVLSLDFRGDEFLGDPRLLEDPELWPDRVVVMTLGRVGSGAGPDRERLAAIARRAGERSIFAAGGVRGPEDLEALAAQGVAGALVASALHDGSLGPREIARLAGPSAEKTVSA